MNHKFIKKNSAYTLVLLHGTGGNMDDLVYNAQFLNAEANLVLLEGDVLEFGQKRFFKRFMDGSYDLDDLDKRARKLNETTLRLSHTYGFDLTKTCYVGFSNGANLVLYSFLNLNPAAKKLISFHGMLKNMPTSCDLTPDLYVFFSIGMFDPLTTYKASLDSLKHFHAKSIQVTKYVARDGHQITVHELEEAKKWYQQNKD